MTERKAFLAILKQQDRASQCGGHYYSFYNKKTGDYYNYQSLPNFTNEL